MLDLADGALLSSGSFSGRCLRVRPARHGIDWNIDSYFSLMCLHSAGDLHRRQHKATGRVDHKIDWHILWRALDRRNYCSRIFQIDVPGNGKAEKATLLLTMDHRDNTRPVQFF